MTFLLPWDIKERAAKAVQAAKDEARRRLAPPSAPRRPTPQPFRYASELPQYESSLAEMRAGGATPRQPMDVGAGLRRAARFTYDTGAEALRRSGEISSYLPPLALPGFTEESARQSMQADRSRRRGVQEFVDRQGVVGRAINMVPQVAIGGETMGLVRGLGASAGLAAAPEVTSRLPEGWARTLGGGIGAGVGLLATRGRSLPTTLAATAAGAGVGALAPDLPIGLTIGGAGAAAAGRLESGVRSLNRQAALEATRRAAPEAFQYGRQFGEDLTPRRLFVQPPGQTWDTGIGNRPPRPPRPIRPDVTVEPPRVTGGLAGGAGETNGMLPPQPKPLRPITQRDVERIKAKIAREGMTEANRAELNEALGRALGAITPDEQVARAAWNRPAAAPSTPAEALRNARIEENIGRRLGMGPGDAAPSGRTLYHGTRGEEVQSFADLQAGRPTRNQHGVMGATMPYDSTRAAVFLTDNPEFARQYGDRMIEGSVPEGKAIRLGGKTLDDKFNEFGEWAFEQWRSSGDNALREMGVAVRYARKTPEAWQLFEGKQGEQFVRFLREQGYDYARFVERIPTQADQAKTVRGETTAVLNPERLRPAPAPVTETIQQRAQRPAQGAPEGMGVEPPREQLPMFPLQEGGQAGGAIDTDLTRGAEAARAAAEAAAPTPGAGAPPTAPPGGPPAAQGALPGMPPIKRNGVGAYVHDLVLDALELGTGGLKAAFDLSGLRQLGPSAYAHPKRTARALRQEVRALFSEANFQANEARIDAQPWAQLRNSIAPNWRRTVDPGAGPPQVRTGLMRAANMLGYRGYNRAFAALLNTMDDELFGAMLQADGRPMLSIPAEELEAMSRMANISSGRGPLPAAFKNTVAGVRLAWAPALLSSRVSLPLQLVANNAAVRKEAARQLVAFVAVNSAALATGKALGLWDVDLEPTSADFGQARVGNQRIDVWAGYRPVANLVARMKAGGVTSTRTGQFYSKSRQQIALDFLRSKAAPGVSTAINLAVGKDLTGKEFGLGDVPRDLLAPLFLDELYEAITNGGTLADVTANGRAAAQRGGIAGLGFIGAGVTTHTPTPGERAAQGEYRQLPHAQQIEAIPDEAWRRLQSSEQFKKPLAKFETYGQWRDAQLASLAQQLQQRGLSPEAAADRAQAELRKTSIYKAQSATKGLIEDAWVKADPASARAYWLKERDKPASEYPWRPTQEQLAILERAR